MTMEDDDLGEKIESGKLLKPLTKQSSIIDSPLRKIRIDEADIENSPLKDLEKNFTPEKQKTQ